MVSRQSVCDTPPMTDRQQWSDDEVQFVIDHPGWTSRQVANHLGRTESAVNSKRRGMRLYDAGLAGGAAKPWTDEEIGFVADHDDWTPLKIACALGRSEQSIRHARRNMREGFVKSREYWTDAEDDLLLECSDLSARQAAEVLGRTKMAIDNRRHQLDDYVSVTKRPERVASRKLVAKSCKDCGLILDAWWYRLVGNGSYSSNCRKCVNSARARPPVRSSGLDLAARQRRQQLQAVTLDSAHHHRQPWTTQDYEKLADPDLTHLEKALILGRTYMAVTAACYANGFTSKVGLGDPNRHGRWIIDSPSVQELLQDVA